MSLGVGPTIALAGSSLASSRAANPPDGSERDRDEEAKRWAVVVFPHHFGPWMSTAPKIPRSLSTTRSIHLPMYSPISTPFRVI